MTKSISYSKPAIINRYAIYVLAAINGAGVTILFMLMNDSPEKNDAILGYSWLVLYFVSPIILGYLHPRNISHLLLALTSGATLGMVVASIFHLPQQPPGPMDSPIGYIVAAPLVFGASAAILTPSFITTLIGSWLARKRGY